MDGFASGGNGYPHTEQRFTLPSQVQCGGSSVFFIAMPAVYAVLTGIQSPVEIKLHHYLAMGCVKAPRPMCALRGAVG
jgi:hypothetical protein